MIHDLALLVDILFIVHLSSLISALRSGVLLYSRNSIALGGWCQSWWIVREMAAK